MLRPLVMLINVNSENKFKIRYMVVDCVSVDLTL